VDVCFFYVYGVIYAEKKKDRFLEGKKGAPDLGKRKGG